MKTILAALGLWVMAAASVSAQSPDAPEPVAPPVITAETLVFTQEDLAGFSADYYPLRAQEDEVEGKAVLACEVGSGGQVARCVVLSETPAGYGFGRWAALTLLKYARVDMSKNTAGSWLRQTMNFKLG